MAGVATATIYVIPAASAASCKGEFRHSCHGCSADSQGPSPATKNASTLDK
ncbi:MAG: hypothetical protein WCA39_10055 [Nitrososphaeraceae archaeon]